MSQLQFATRFGNERAKALANKLCEWLEATTSYVDLKEGLDRNWPCYDDKRNRWRRFYQHGPVLMANESGILGCDEKPTGLVMVIKSVCYDKEAQPGEIITSGNGKRYMVREDGSLRKV
jgi:hypothetical protein